MAINVEAANMAGYNYPKIEVFKVTTDPTTNNVTDAPSKTEIIRCFNRGSIPAIMQTKSDGTEGNLLWFTTRLTDNEGDSIYFASPTGSVLAYLPFSEIPTFEIAGP